MSRSYRKIPRKSWAKRRSMKSWRRRGNKRHRLHQKELIKYFLVCDDWDNYVPRVIREDCDVWDSPLDGGVGWYMKPHENSTFNPVTEEFDNKWYNLANWKKEFRK